MKKYFLYRDNKGRIYYALLPAAMRRHSMRNPDINIVAFRGMSLFNQGLLVRVARGVYVKV